MNRTPILFLNVLVIATCGLVYELLAGTLASYVLGDSVTQFSLIIGIYLFAMGIGSWLSRFFDRELAPVLVTTAIFTAFGLLVFGIAYLIILKATPFSIRKEIEEDQNVALAVVIGAVIIGISLIIAAAIQG